MSVNTLFMNARLSVVLLATLLFSISISADDISDQRGELGRINDPVQDAKQAYRNGIKEFVGIDLKGEVLVFGIKGKKEDYIRKHYRIRPINQRWQSFENIEDDPKRFYKLKRYVNRYNLMMLKLIENEQPKKKQYRY